MERADFCLLRRLCRNFIKRKICVKHGRKRKLNAMFKIHNSVTVAPITSYQTNFKRKGKMFYLQETVFTEDCDKDCREIKR